MFAYCNNNPVCLEDSNGGRSQTCIDNEQNVMKMPWSDGNIGGKSAYSLIISPPNPNPWVTSQIATSIECYVTNTDPKAAMDGKGITFYNGTPVIHLPFEWTAFSFGVIVLGSQYESNSYGITTLNHEYGHILQLKKYGFLSYTWTIAIPSLTCNLLDRAKLLPWTYYSSPWEYEADQFGGVTRMNYASWASEVSAGYSYFSTAIEMIGNRVIMQK